VSPGISRKRVHVLGGGAWQIPTIRLAKSLGYAVLVTDMYEDAPGYAYADDHERIDIRDRARTLASARQHRIDGIICDTTDVGVPTAAYVADELGLQGIGYETALRFTDKALMREAAAKAGVLQPAYVVLSGAEELGQIAEMRFPLAVKPVDNQASRGVHKVGSRAELESAVRDALEHSNVKRVLVEEWIDGTEVTVEGMCFGGRVSALGISDKERYARTPQIASRLTYPPAMSDEVVAAIRHANVAVIGALGLRTGVTHAEYVVTPDGRIYFVEIAARGGGNRLYTHIVPYLSGVPLPRCYLEWTLGSDDPWPQPDGVARAAILDFFDVPIGTIRSIEGVAEAARLPGVADLGLELSVGSSFKGAENDRARPGYVVVYGETRAEVIAIAERAKQLVRIEVEEQRGIAL